VHEATGGVAWGVCVCVCGGGGYLVVRAYPELTRKNGKRELDQPMICRISWRAV